MVKSAAGLLNGKNGDEAAAKKAAAGMKGLHLRVFEFDKKGMYKFEDLKAVRDQLKGPHWTKTEESQPESAIRGTLSTTYSTYSTYSSPFSLT